MKVKVKMKTALTPKAIDIALKLIDEINSSAFANLKNEKFVQALLSDLVDINFEAKEIDSLHFDRLIEVGRAAVRAYQSFDNIPETDLFVELACRLSAALKEEH